MAGESMMTHNRRDMLGLTAAAIAASADRQEGVAAFQQKRKAEFPGT